MKLIELCSVINDETLILVFIFGEGNKRSEDVFYGYMKNLPLKYANYIINDIYASEYVSDNLKKTMAKELKNEKTHLTISLKMKERDNEQSV